MCTTIHIQKRKLEPSHSDHIPIIFHVSTSPIQIPIKERTNFKKANWDKCKEILETNEIISNNNLTNEEIEQYSEKWTKQIQHAASETIPKTKTRTLPHTKINHEIRQLNILHDELLLDINNNGTNYIKYQRLLTLRQQLQNEYFKLKTESWNELIKNTERNSKDFWKSIKRMIGQNTITEQRYIKGNHNEDIYEDEEKEQIFRNYWKNIFKISEEENNQFHRVNEVNVKQYLIEKAVRKEIARFFNPQQRNDFAPVTSNEIVNIIKSLKQRSPGEDDITKYHLSKLPNNMIENFNKTIINNCLAIGYYSIMIFIPKSGKSPKHHTNYRPWQNCRKAYYLNI